MRVQTKAQCPDCGRAFDLLDPDDAGEWFCGHDCEPDGAYHPSDVHPDG